VKHEQCCHDILLELSIKEIVRKFERFENTVSMKFAFANGKLNYLCWKNRASTT
jgi:hypothetical protein